MSLYEKRLGRAPLRHVDEGAGSGAGLGQPAGQLLSEIQLFQSGKNVVFVRDKSSVDTKALFRKVKKWLDPMNTMINSCNRAYYGITPRIIAKKLSQGFPHIRVDYYDTTDGLCVHRRDDVLQCRGLRAARMGSPAGKYV